ncbi:hypothetical protein PR048_024615 [Dryococelus australis]|uniref:Uncharacterized protein n=1 Tax=Dryococelus australis TaxID=614101 RepID=A0ABQ9GP29_9NEOP|nr:hypothetical protein PR048_024615 [Dryococelus australis]
MMCNTSAARRRYAETFPARHLPGARAFTSVYLRLGDELVQRLEDVPLNIRDEMWYMNDGHKCVQLTWTMWRITDNTCKMNAVPYRLISRNVAACAPVIRRESHSGVYTRTSPSRDILPGRQSPSPAPSPSLSARVAPTQGHADIVVVYPTERGNFPFNRITIGGSRQLVEASGGMTPGCESLCEVSGVVPIDSRSVSVLDMASGTTSQDPHRPGFDSRSGHPEFGFPWFPEIAPGDCWDGSLTKATADSFPDLRQSLFPAQFAPSLMTSLSTRRPRLDFRSDHAALCPPPPLLTKANRVRFPVESLAGFRMWKSCRTMQLLGGFPRGYTVSQPLHSGAAPFSPHFTLIGFQDLDVNTSEKRDSTRPNFLFRWEEVSIKVYPELEQQLDPSIALHNSELPVASITTALPMTPGLLVSAEGRTSTPADRGVMIYRENDVTSGERRGGLMARDKHSIQRVQQDIATLSQSHTGRPARGVPLLSSSPVVLVQSPPAHTNGVAPTTLREVGSAGKVCGEMNMEQRKNTVLIEMEAPRENQLGSSNVRHVYHVRYSGMNPHQSTQFAVVRLISSLTTRPPWRALTGRKAIAHEFVPECHRDIFRSFSLNLAQTLLCGAEVWDCNVA